MRLPDETKIAAMLERRATQGASPVVFGRNPVSSIERFGKIVNAGPTLLRATLPDVALGELCHIEPAGITAEVVAMDRETAMLSPFSDPDGLRCGERVRPLGTGHRVWVGDHLIGGIVDGLGYPLAAKPPGPDAEARPLEGAPPDPLTRRLIDTPLALGVRAIDGMLTCGRGQRIGIFAAAGVGKSSLLGMICDGSLADVIVLALVGERGREVREFLEDTLTEEARSRCVVVVATSDKSALERFKAAYTATTIAEYFRDQGKDVLLMVDSITRLARAGREIGLAAGEPPTAGGYPPSVFARLPRLLERAGCAQTGSITAIYTVLVEGDDMNGPVADEVRSILDGHIVLSRKLAEANHYPAIDVGMSVSRLMHRITSREHQQYAARMRRLLACYKDIELLVRVGEYQRGNDPEADEALDRKNGLDQFLCQSRDDKSDFEDTIDNLRNVVEG